MTMRPHIPSARLTDEERQNLEAFALDIAKRSRFHTGLSPLPADIPDFEPAPDLNQLVQQLINGGHEFLHAVRKGNAGRVERALEAGFPVNYQEPLTGQTALHVAAASQARKVLRLLLNTGECDFLLRDKKGRLASEMAYIYGDDPAMARLLGIKERKQAEAQGIKLTRRPAPAA